MKKLALVLLILSILPAATPLLQSAQNGYSLAGANVYMAKQDWPDLLTYTQGWTRANPGDPTAWYYMGQAYGYGLNRQADAANAFERAVSLQPVWPEAWWALAYTDVQLARYPNALNAVSKAVQQSPGRFNYWNGLAMVYSALNRWDDVVRTLEEEQRRMETARNASDYDWYNLGNGFKNSTRYKQAEAAFGRALTLNPRMGLAWNNLGVVEQALGNFKAALADYQRAASLGDGFASGNYTRLNQALTQPPASPSPRGGSNTFAATMAQQYATKQQQFHDWAFQHPNSPVSANPHSY
jgi:tetratricopeptide (TPR) repeat protein